MKYPELEAKYGVKNLFRIAGTDCDGNPFEIICVKPTRSVIQAVLEEKSEAKIIDIYVNNCAVGGDLEALGNADVYSKVAGDIAEKAMGATTAVKKY